MAVNMSGRYLGGLKVELTHGPSGTKILTAAPVDNQGDGSSFSPTDLVAAALGACMVTVMGIAAEREGIPLAGVTFTVEKNMADNPRRIGSVPVRIHMPAHLTAEQRQKLENAALACPVGRSLPAEIERDVRFVYPD